MDTQENIRHYQDLYNEYMELIVKTTLEAYTVETGGKISTQNISLTDLERREKVQEELKKGLEFLTDNQLINLSEDIKFSKIAQEILSKRREIT